MTEQLKVDATALQAHMRCPKKYYWRHRRHLSRGGKSPPLAFGSAIHEALEVMTKKDTPNEQRLMLALQKFKKEYPEDLDGRRTQTGGILMLTTFFERRRASFPDIIATETRFAFDWHEILLVGKLDCVYTTSGGGIGFKDYKTASRIGASYTNRYTRDFQIAMYQYATTVLFGRCDQVAVDVLPVMKSDCVPKLYEFDYSEIPPQFEATLGQECAEISQSDKTGVWPEKWTSCLDFGSCPYHILCTNPETQDTLLERFFEVEPWEPWKEEEKK